MQQINFTFVETLSWVLVFFCVTIQNWSEPDKKEINVEAYLFVDSFH